MSTKNDETELKISHPSYIFSQVEIKFMITFHDTQVALFFS